MSRVSSLDEPADLHAEHGSKTWARGVARKLQLEVKKLDSDVSTVQGWIEIASENEVWRILGYISLDSFLVAEANISQALIDSIRSAKSGTSMRDVVNDAKANPAAKHGEIGNGRSRDKDLTSTPANSNDGILRKLARDGLNELLDAIANEEISINAAAIKAGYRKKKTPEELVVSNFRKCENRLETLRAVFCELEVFEREVIKGWLLEGNQS